MFSITDELKFVIEPQVNPYRGPLFITRSLESPVGDNIIVNGGFGLVDTGKSKLLVTCQHIWKRFQDEHSRDSNVRMCVCLDQHAPVVFDQNEPIDHDSNLDIAAFDISPVLAACGGRQFYRLDLNPAPSVTKGDKVVLLGNQGMFRSATGEGVEFGVTTYACEVSDVSGLRVVANLSTARKAYAKQPVRTPEVGAS